MSGSIIKNYYHSVNLLANELLNSRLHNISSSGRISLGLTLTIDSKGYMVYDTDVKLPYFWDGSTWQQAGGTWGNIAGVITNQTDLINYLSVNYTPQLRSLSINGISYNLTTDRAWVLTTSDITEGTNLYYTNTRARAAISLTTTGSSGAASYSNTTGVLNIPTYTLTGLGGVSSTLTSGNIFVGNASNVATGVTLTLNSATGTFGLSNIGVLTIPDASATVRGFVSLGTQVFAGNKTFNSSTTFTVAPTFSNILSGGTIQQHRLLATGSTGLLNNVPNLIWDNTVLGLGIGKVPTTGKALDVSGNVAISSLATASTGTYKMVVSSGTLGSLSLQDIPSISGESYNGQFYSECIQSTYSVSNAINMSFEITDFTNGIVMDGSYSSSSNYVSVTGNVLTLNNYVNYRVFNESAYLVGTGFETFTLTNAAISGTTLTFVSGSGYYGFPKAGDIIIGPGVAENTRVVAYDQINQLITVSIPQTVSITGTMYIYGTKILSKISGTTWGIGSTYLLNNSLVTSITNQLVSLYNFRFARFSYNGKYNIQFTAQFKNTDTVAQDVDIWLIKTGFPIEESKNTITIPAVHGGSNTPGYAIASWGYIVDAIADDYVGIYWKATNANTVTLESSPTVGSAPSTPACSLRITVVSGLVSGTALGSINYMSVTSTGGNYIISPDNTGIYLPSSTDVEISYGAVPGGSLGGIYLRIPTAGSSSTIARGLVTNVTQSFYGAKTFAAGVTFSTTSLHTGIATFTAAPVFSSTTASTLLTVGATKALTSFASSGVIKTTAGVPSTMNGTTNALTYWTDADTISFLNTATYPTLLELSYVKGVTSAIQTQLNGKQATLTNPVTGTGTNNEIAYFNTTGSTIGSLTTATYPSLTELSYVKGVTSNIQTQIGGKQASSTNLTSLAGLTYASTSFVKMTAAGTFALDTNTYQTSLTFSTGLTNSSGTITNNLSTGVSGGQSVVGGTAASNSLTLSSTTNATKGKLLFGTSAYDEVNNRLGVGTNTPVGKIQVDLVNTDYTNTAGAGSHILLNNSSTTGQNVVTSIINGAIVAKWRTDYVGNISWVAGSTGGHQFYTGGDYAVGSAKLSMFNNGNVKIQTATVGGAVTDNGYKLDVQATLANTNSSVVYFKNLNSTLGSSPIIALDSDNTTGPVDIRLGSTNPKGIRIYASNSELTTSPTGAGFQFFTNSSSLPGQVYFDSGANNSAAIIFRTAQTAGTITERMRITAAGDIQMPSLTNSTQSYVVGYNVSSKQLYYQAAGGGGGGTPASPTGSVQFNNAGSFGGDTNLVWDNTNKWLGIGGTPGVKLDIYNNDTTKNTAQFGTIGIQSYATNNAWFGDNVYYDGTGFIRREDGYTGAFYFQGSEGQFRWGNSGFQGDPVTNGASGYGLVSLKTGGDGTFAVGDLSAASGSYDTGGATFIVYPPYSGHKIAKFNRDGISPIEIVAVDENISAGYSAVKGSIGNTPTGLFENMDGSDNYTSWRKMTRPYRSYVCQLTQSGTSAPSPIVLENDLGYTPTWARSGTGQYNLTAGADNVDFANENNTKIVVFFNGGRYSGNYIEFGMQANARWSKEENLVYIETGIQVYCVSGDGCQSSWAYDLQDNILTDGDGDNFFPASFELRIYD